MSFLALLCAPLPSYAQCGADGWCQGGVTSYARIFFKVISRGGDGRFVEVLERVDCKTNTTDIKGLNKCFKINDNGPPKISTVIYDCQQMRVAVFNTSNKTGQWLSLSKGSAGAKTLENACKE